MARRGNDHEDIIFYFRFILEPFRSIPWASCYLAIGLVLTLIDYLFIGTPEPETDPNRLVLELLGPLQVVFHLRLLLPALGFLFVGTLGLLTCMIREVRDQAR